LGFRKPGGREVAELIAREEFAPWLKFQLQAFVLPYSFGKPSRGLPRPVTVLKLWPYRACRIDIMAFEPNLVHELQFPTK
jgi:hypothetical protein